jgi:hypothetical protein
LISSRECRAVLESIIEEYDKGFTILYDPDEGHPWKASYVKEAMDWILEELC